MNFICEIFRLCPKSLTVSGHLTKRIDIFHEINSKRFNKLLFCIDVFIQRCLPKKLRNELFLVIKM